MAELMLEFINYAYDRHLGDGHRGDFETCPRRTCRRARQLEIYLILTGKWLNAAYNWMTENVTAN